jgi:hypothetical protein
MNGFIGNHISMNKKIFVHVNAYQSASTTEEALNNKISRTIQPVGITQSVLVANINRIITGKHGDNAQDR